MFLDEGMFKFLDQEEIMKQPEEMRYKMILDLLNKAKMSNRWISHINSSRVPKSVKKSEKFRKLANNMYVKKAGAQPISDCLELLTKSIAYAPVDSEEISLAYGNRSAILLKIQLYEDALLDISRALKSNYPDRLKSKLFLRRAMCYKAINANENRIKIEKALENARGWLRRMHRKDPARQKISNALDNPEKMEKLPPLRIKWSALRFLKNVFEENPKIIGASNSINIQYRNDKLSAHAQRDIKPGEMVAIQESYASCLPIERRYTNCWQCFTQVWSAIPCNYCIHVVYCSEKCRDAAWSEHHETVCSVVMFDWKNNVIETIVLRMMVNALKETGSLQGLKDYIERIEMNLDKTKEKLARVFDGTKLESIYTLPLFPETLLSLDNFDIIMDIQFLIFSMAYGTQIFGNELTVPGFYTNKWVPFIIGLMMKFYMITQQNMHVGLDMLDSVENRHCSVKLLPLYDLMSHTCAPRMTVCAFGKKTVLYALHPIKKGEEISLCQKQPYWAMETAKRQEILTPLLGVPCRCIACTENWPSQNLLRCIDRGLPNDMINSYLKFKTAMGENIRPSMTGNFIVIAKRLNDISMMSTVLWKYMKEPTEELRNISMEMQIMFSILGNRYEDAGKQIVKIEKPILIDPKIILSRRGL